MKLPYKIALIVVALIFFYLLIKPSNSKISSTESAMPLDEYIDFKIYKNELYHKFYDFKLTSKNGENHLFTKYDSSKGSYYLKSSEVEKGDYVFEIISEFDSIKKIDLFLYSDTSFKLDTSLIHNYDIDKANYNYFKDRIKKNLPFNLLFESNGCFSDHSIRYSINSDSNKLETVKQYKQGKFIISFEVDKNKFYKKLLFLLFGNENPKKEWTYLTDSSGHTDVILNLTSSVSSSIYLEYDKRVYSVWSGDMTTDKYRKTFYDLYNGFKYPKLEMKF